MATHTVVTVHILVPETDPGCVADWVSGLLSENENVPDWGYASYIPETVPSAGYGVPITLRPNQWDEGDFYDHAGLRYPVHPPKNQEA